MRIRLSKQAEKFVRKQDKKTVQRIIFNDQELSQEEIKEIEEAKVQIARGEYTDLDALKKEFGL